MYFQKKKTAILLPIIHVKTDLMLKRRVESRFSTEEDETGVSIHFIDDEKIDKGNIIIQKKLRIKPDDTDGILRSKLARLSEKALSDALNLIIIKNKKEFLYQDEKKKSYYPKRSLRHSKINLDQKFNKIMNQIRANTPYPGARVKMHGREYIVDNAVLIRNKYKKNNKGLVLKSLNGEIQFNIREEKYAEKAKRD